jgi:hypothetical protein
MDIGSDAHRDLFCSQFFTTYSDYDPETLPWPDLTEAELTKLRTVPFWQEVLHTERRAGAIVRAFAPTVEDPLVRKAVALQGDEEVRHAELLRVMIRRYGLNAIEQPLEPLNPDIVTAFKDFGFGECLDSFLGFGAFKLARQNEFLPEGMFRIFDTLMYEETRHIVFFVNWMAWDSVRNGRGAAWRRHMVSLRYYGRAIGRLVGTVRRGQEVNHGQDFSATQTSLFLEDFTFRRFLEDCHDENLRRMGELDPTLLKPAFLPKLADIALASLRLWSLGGRRAKAAA